MNARHTLMALAMVVLAVVVQTTLLADDRLRPFGVSANLVLLVVIGVVRYLEAEPAILLGFTAGLMVDLLGGSPLGLWALSLTVVAYLSLRVRDRFADGPTIIAPAVFVLTFVGAALFVVLGTIFGIRTLSDPSVWRKLVLPGLYNVVLAAAVLPVITQALRARGRRGWAT